MIARGAQEAVVVSLQSLYVLRSGQEQYPVRPR